MAPIALFVKIDKRESIPSLFRLCRSFKNGNQSDLLPPLFTKEQQERIVPVERIAPLEQIAPIALFRNSE